MFNDIFTIQSHTTASKAQTPLLRLVVGPQSRATSCKILKCHAVVDVFVFRWLVAQLAV